MNCNCTVYQRTAGRAFQCAGKPPLGRRGLPVLRASKQEPDLIERMVGALFGKKVLEDPEPFGLKRIDFEKLPDQRVELEAEAALLPQDEGNVAILRPLLANTQLETSPLRCAYDASVHGWTPQAFHRCVDGFGAAIVVAVTGGGAVCGGYNPEGWISLGEDRASNGAFLFSWPDANTKAKATKLPKVGGPNLAVIDKPDTGPWFGAEGLTIPLKGRGGEERQAKCRLGTYYQRMPDNTRSIFATGENPKKVQLASLQAYVAEGEGVQYELDGIVWKSKVGK